MRARSVIESHILPRRFARISSVAEGWIRQHRVEVRFLRRVYLLQHIPVVRQRVPVDDFKHSVLHPVQQHVHAGEVVGREGSSSA